MSTTELFEQSLRYFLTPVRDLLEDDSVSEVMVNGHERIYVERGGKLERVPNRFESADQLEACARNIAQFAGKRIVPHEPRVDARLPDGSRVHIVMPPVARDGISITIRRFSKSTLTMERLIEYGSINPEGRELLELGVLLRKNILVSGGTGSGKTSLLNALSAVIPSDERIVVMEDTSELQLQQEHVLRLEARKPDRHGKGEVTIRDLLHSSLRMRPDRVLVGECRSGEALDMIQAMNTGHSGSMTTVHANSARDALARIETLALMAGLDLPLVPLRAQVASALHLVVQTDRLQDGSRKITSIHEVLPLDEEGRYVVSALLAFVQTGRDDQGRVTGSHQLTGGGPTFWSEVAAKGLQNRSQRLREAYARSPARKRPPQGSE